MSQKARNYREENYRPLLGKSVRNILVKRVRRQYGFENNRKLAEILIDDILEHIAKYTASISALKPGQMLWMAVAKDERVAHKPMDEHRLVPVILTLVTEDEIKKLRYGANPLEIRQERIVRMFQEAHQQNGVLGHNDIALLLGYSRSIISAQVKDYQDKNTQMLPSRGWMHDLGPTTTHKARIVELHLQGYLTQEISRITLHTPRAVDRYIRDFEKVKILYGLTTEQISKVTGLEMYLVEQYQVLIERYLADNLPDIKKTKFN